MSTPAASKAPAADDAIDVEVDFGLALGSASASSGELEPGQSIADKYRLEERLAEGGMGVLFRATHVELERRVAIKVVRPEHAQNEEIVARLLAEARTAASLRSEHVNRVLDVGRLPSGAPYIVLELLEGSDLACHLEARGRFGATQAVDCVLQACEGLAEAHALGIVHRDLKPENLFLNEEPNGELLLKILDFGISKSPAARRAGRVLTDPWQVLGSPSYMAPEQMRRASIVDARADVWALGVVLYELCTGEVPFDADEVKQVFAQVLNEEPEPPSRQVDDLPEGLERVILRCLRKNPGERFQNVAELAQALAPFASDASFVGRVAKMAGAASARERERTKAPLSRVMAAPPGTPMALASSPEASQLQLPLRARTGRAALLTAAVATLCVSVGAGYWATRNPDAERPPAAPAERVRPPSSKPPSIERDVNPERIETALGAPATLEERAAAPVRAAVAPRVAPAVVAVVAPARQRSAPLSRYGLEAAPLSAPAAAEAPLAATAELTTQISAPAAVSASKASAAGASAAEDPLVVDDQDRKQFGGRR